VSDFQKLAPNSIYLSKDLSNYSKGKGLNNDMTMGPHSGAVQNNIYTSVTLMAGLKFKRTENSSLRIGIGYVSGENFSSNYLLETISTYDTLTSIKTGQKIYVQEKNVDEYAMKNSYEHLRLDVSYILKAKLNKRFSFYSGIGATAGISFNNITEIEHTNHMIYDGYKDNVLTSGTEAFQNKNSGAFSAYIPLGLNLRLGGNRCEFFKRISIFAESRPTVNIINIPELKTYTYVSLQNGIGLRFKI
jgi:opacity protein-like surface antigen